MKSKDLFYDENVKFSNAEERAYAREELVYNVAEDLLIVMEDSGVSKAELSRRLGKSKSYVTQILGGARNMTLNTFSDICFALNFKPEVRIPVQENKEIIFQKWVGHIQENNSSNVEITNSLNVIDRTDKLHWENIKVA
jgi:antitoxin component HigA of HigAB toxin-antitoxin module